MLRHGPLRVAIVFDDHAQQRRFGEQFGAGARVYYLPGGDELLKLAVAGDIDAAVVGVLNRADDFLPAALQALSRVTPDVAAVGVFEPSLPSLDEAAELARDIPTLAFVRRPGERLNYLIRRRPPAGTAPTVTSKLLDCMARLPLYGAARSFALLQALHPSSRPGISDQAQELGLSRRSLERWFQGPDLCSAACFQSVCAAAEAAYLRLVCELSDREIAPVVDIFTREGLENPQAVPRMIRSALRAGLDELRRGGIPVLLEAVDAALRSSNDQGSVPAQWGAETRFVPQPGVLAVPVEDRLVLMDVSRGLEHPLDSLGMDVWPLVMRGATLAEMVAELARFRREPIHAVRTGLIARLGKLLVLGLIRRERPDVRAANGE